MVTTLLAGRQTPRMSHHGASTWGTCSEFGRSLLIKTRRENAVNAVTENDIRLTAAGKASFLLLR